MWLTAIIFPVDEEDKETVCCESTPLPLSFSEGEGTNTIIFTFLNDLQICIFGTRVNDLSLCFHVLLPPAETSETNGGLKSFKY